MRLKLFILLIFISLNNCTISYDSLFEKFYRSSKNNSGKGYKYFLYFGNNVSGLNGDIYKYDIDMTTGYLSNMRIFDDTEVTYLAVSPSVNHLYAAHSGGHAIYCYNILDSNGTLNTSPSVFVYGNSVDKIFIQNGLFLYGYSIGGADIFNAKIDESNGSLTLFNSLNFTVDGPYDLAIKPSGDYLYIVNNNPPYYINSYLINQNTGAINSPVQLSSSGTNPEAIVIHPFLNYLFVANAGSNTIQSYSINPVTGQLTQIVGSVSSGGTNPNSLIIDKSGKYLYCANLNCISGFYINQIDGSLTSLTGSPYFPHSGHTNLNYITVDPTGKYIYAPMFGTNFVDGFSIDQSNGNLTLLTPVWTYPDTYASNPIVVKIKQ